MQMLQMQGQIAAQSAEAQAKLEMVNEAIRIEREKELERSVADQKVKFKNDAAIDVVDQEFAESLAKQRETSAKRRIEELKLLEQERLAQEAMLKQRQEELEAQMHAKALAEEKERLKKEKEATAKERE